MDVGGEAVGEVQGEGAEGLLPALDGGAFDEPGGPYRPTNPSAAVHPATGTVGRTGVSRCLAQSVAARSSRTKPRLREADYLSKTGTIMVSAITTSTAMIVIRTECVLI